MSTTENYWMSETDALDVFISENVDVVALRSRIEQSGEDVFRPSFLAAVHRDLVEQGFPIEEADRRLDALYAIALARRSH